MYGKNKKEAIPPLEVNGELVYEDAKKADALNEFFRSCSHIDGHDGELDFSTDVPQAMIENIKVERNEVFKY